MKTLLQNIQDFGQLKESYKIEAGESFSIIKFLCHTSWPVTDYNPTLHNVKSYRAGGGGESRLSFQLSTKKKKKKVPASSPSSPLLLVYSLLLHTR